MYWMVQMDLKILTRYICLVLKSYHKRKLVTVCEQSFQESVLLVDTLNMKIKMLSKEVDQHKETERA